MRSDAGEMRSAAVGNTKKSRLRALATAFDNIWPGAAPASAYLAMVSTSAMTWIALRHLWRIKHTSMEPHFSSPHQQGQMEAVCAGGCRSNDDLDDEAATISSSLLSSYSHSPCLHHPQAFKPMLSWLLH
uniref:Uncharacterized protein n=1 Tax=Oryza glumipatula TaxID=40148 RepID=A0A0E0A394_9ORYZ